MNETDAERKKKGYVPALCFLTCAAGYMSIYVSRLNLTMANAHLTDPAEGIMTVSEIGILGTVFTIIYAVFRFTNSILADRLKPWILLCSGLLICGLSNICFSLFPSFVLLAVLWGLNGFGQSMLWGSIISVFSTVYEREKAGKRLALLSSSILVGNVIGILLSSFLIMQSGLRSAFYVPGAINIAVSLALFFAVRKVPFEAKSTNLRDHLRGAFGMLRDRDLLRQLVPVVLHGVVKDNLNLWVAAYFMTFFRIDIKASLGLVLIVPLIGLLGRLIYNPVYSLLRKNELLVAAAGFLVQTLAAFLLLLPGLGTMPAAIFLAVISAMTSLINCSYHAVYPLRFRERGYAATVSGLLDLFIYGGAGLGSAIYGYVIEGKGPEGYLIMFASWGVISVVGAVLLFLAVRARGKEEKA